VLVINEDTSGRGPCRYNRCFRFHLFIYPRADGGFWHRHRNVWLCLLARARHHINFTRRCRLYYRCGLLGGFFDELWQCRYPRFGCLGLWAILFDSSIHNWRTNDIPNYDINLTNFLHLGLFFFFLFFLFFVN